jgi:uncharacterized RDD family membrane protein YckC
MPPPVAPDGRPLADFGSRLLAYMIDSAVISGIVSLIFAPVFVSVLLPRLQAVVAAGQPSSPATDPFNGTHDVGVDIFAPMGDLVWTTVLLELGLFVVVLVAYYVYLVEVLHRSGQTIGKKAMRIRVVPIEPGATLTRGMAARRFLVEVVAGSLVPFFSLVDGLWQLSDKPYQQTLHDKFAKTVVVKVSP